MDKFIDAMKGERFVIEQGIDNYRLPQLWCYEFSGPDWYRISRSSPIPPDFLEVLLLQHKSRQATPTGARL